MHIDTLSRGAFERMSDALQEINEYRRIRDRSRLDTARQFLDEALEEDPGYLNALFYSAVVHDLLGRPWDAVRELERVIREVEVLVEGEVEGSLTLLYEVRYNLAVAFYHHYHRELLLVAVKHFQSLIADARKTNHEYIERLACAGLAQTYAMLEIPRQPHHPDTDEIRRYHDLSLETGMAALRGLERQNGQLNWQGDVEGTVANARGMALMYLSDFFGNREDKLGWLREALSRLERADRWLPRDWANTCDLASAWMRLAYWEKDPTGFVKARHLLEEVVRLLRPGYGFALYEIGRTYRLEGNFPQALDYFDQASKIPVGERDIGDFRLGRETGLAEARSSLYP